MKDGTDVTALGEILVDMTPDGLSDTGHIMYEANPGGAPANVLAMLNKLGHSTAFIGEVGNDFFGEMLRKTLHKLRISDEGLLETDEAHTTLAFVNINQHGERDFNFYRNPGADMLLSRSDIDYSLIAGSKIFHFGTLSMTDEPVREATRSAVQYAREQHILCSFDPNIRMPLWHDENEAKCAMDYGLCHCDILKIADNELQWFTGMEDLNSGMDQLRTKYAIPLIFLTMGKNGSIVYDGTHCIHEPALLTDQTVDTTGAGDTFMGCMLHDILQNGCRARTEESWHSALRFANTAASIITRRKGALQVMPEYEEIQALLK